MTIKQSILRGEWQKPTIELSRHDNDGFSIRLLHIPRGEFPYRLEQYQPGKVIGKDHPLKVIDITEEAARALGLAKAWTNEEILKLMARIENEIRAVSMSLARQCALKLDREILGDEDDREGQNDYPEEEGHWHKMDGKDETPYWRCPCCGNFMPPSVRNCQGCGMPRNPRPSPRPLGKGW